VPNPWGRRGSPAHRAKILSVEQRLIDKGYVRVTGGSGAEKKLGNRFPDLLMEKNGKRVVVQVGKLNKDGTPIARERAALKDLRSDPNAGTVVFVPYK
jgi:hypothetical protein